MQQPPKSAPRKAAPSRQAGTVSQAPRTHDHRHCLASAITRAEQAFTENGSKLTPLRRRVFEEIANSHVAVGAYDVLDRLARKSGERMAPISVYRAIDALLEVGVVHRLESRNAFYACHTPHDGAAAHVALVCERCGAVAEVDGEAVRTTLEAAARGLGFEVHRSVVETAGHCAACARLVA
jgi:Fur family zinc uptake transcriptional regulator